MLFGDTLATATTLALTADVVRTSRGTIGDEGRAADVDIFAVDLSSGDRLVVDIDAWETDLSELDSVLRIFDAGGREVVVNDDGIDPDTGASGLDSAIEFTASATGRFYIGVSGFPNVSYDPTVAGSGVAGSSGMYDLHTTLTRVAATSDVGDTLATARAVVVQAGVGRTENETIGNNSFAANDVDMYAVSLQAGDVLRLDIDAREIGLRGNLDSVLRVFNASGTQVAVNDDASDPDTGVGSADSALRITIPSTGTYYVGVSSYANFQYNPTSANSGTGRSQGDYRLVLNVTRNQTPTPTARQVVWLNFNGGSARNGWAPAQNVPAFSTTPFQIPAADRDRFINRAIQFVIDDYISSGTMQTPSTPLNLPIVIARDFNPSLPGDQPPASGLYQTVFIGGSGDALGQAERVDVGNRVLDDNARVWSDVIGRLALTGTFDQKAYALADTISHEIGHNLGLSHLREDGALMQTGALDNERTDDERFTTRGTLYHTTGTQDDVALLRAALRTVSSVSDMRDATSMLGSVGEQLQRWGVIESNSESRSFSVSARQREVLRFDIDGRELSADGPSFTLTVYGPNGRVVGTSTMGIDPETGYAGDPFVQVVAGSNGVYRATVTANYALGRMPVSGEGVFQLNMQRLTQTVASRVTDAFSVVGESKRLVATAQSRQFSFHDASGDLVTIALTQGSGVVEARLVEGASDNADIASISIRNADAAARISISVTGSGGNRIPDIVVRSARINSLVVDGFDVDRLVVGGNADRVAVLNGVVHDTLSIAGAVRAVEILSTRGLPSGLAGVLTIDESAQTLVVSAVAASASIRTGAVQSATFGGFSGGQFTSRGAVGTVVLNASSTGRFDIGGNVSRFTVNGSFGTTPGVGDVDVENPSSLSVRGELRVLQVTGSLDAAVFATRGIRQRSVGVAASAAGNRASDTVRLALPRREVSIPVARTVDRAAWAAFAAAGGTGGAATASQAVSPRRRGASR